MASTVFLIMYDYCTSVRLILLPLLSELFLTLILLLILKIFSLYHNIVDRLISVNVCPYIKFWLPYKLFCDIWFLRL